MITSKQQKNLYKTLIIKKRLTIQNFREIYSTPDSLKNAIGHFLNSGLILLSETHGVYLWTGKRDSEADKKLGLVKDVDE